MMKKIAFKRMPFLLMAVCAAVLVGCDDEEASAPKQTQAAAVVEESGEECLQRAIDKLSGEGKDIEAADAAAKKALELMPDSAEARLVDGQAAYMKKEYKRAVADFAFESDDTYGKPELSAAKKQAGKWYASNVGELGRYYDSLFRLYAEAMADNR